MTNYHLDAVSMPLAVARRRVWTNFLLNAVVAGATVGAGAFAVLEGVRRVTPEGFADVTAAVGLGGLSSLQQSVICAVITTAVVTIAVVFSLWSTLPREHDLARRADRELDLKERFSTALEVVRAGHRNAMVAALLDDVRRRAAAVDPRRIEPFRLPPLAWCLACFLAIGLVLQLAPVTTSSGAAGVPARAAAAVELPALTAEDRVGVAEAIRAAAEDIQAEAVAADDGLLEAVGRTLENLGAEVAAGDGLDRREIAAELGALLEQTGAGVALPDAPVAATTAAEALDRLMQAVQPAAPGATPQLMAAPGAEGEGNTIEPALDEDHQAPMVIGRTAERGIGDGTRQTPSERMQGNVGGIQVQLGNEWEDDDVVNEARAGGAARPNAAAGNLGVETQAQPGARTAAGPGLGDNPPPNGGGTQRTDLGGETAGFGVQADAGPVVPAEPLEYEIDHGLELNGAVNPDGRRIQLDIPPPPPIEGIAELAPDAAAAWARNPEAAIARVLLDPAARDLVARYFAALVPVEETP